MKKLDLDVVDIAILTMLQEDATLRNKEIAARCFLSESATHSRLKKLEALGIITGYTIILRKKEIDLNHISFITARLISHNENSLKVLRTAIAGFQEIKECNLTDSNNGLLLKVVVKDMVAYHLFYHEKFLSIPGIADIKSFAAIAEKKCETVIKL